MDELSLLNQFREALNTSLAEAKASRVQFEGLDAAGEVRGGVEDLVDHYGALMDDLRDDKEDNSELARDLLHLHSIYFPSSRQFNDDMEPEPNPTWLSEQELDNVFGLEADTYKQVLRDLGYGPVRALTKDALDYIWHSLYACPSDIQPCDVDRYAVVSYVQCADKKPPECWTTEVDAVLTTMVEMQVISDKALWFDKLASRQYNDSQKWWAATATMQFLFNPVIVILPRVSERQSFAAGVRQTLWGSKEADKIFARYLRHAESCSKCQESYVLRWALKQDYVMPIAALRTWPRVEHMLGAHGSGLFTSDTSYAALAALLTCSYAMFSTLFHISRGALFHELLVAGLLPVSTYTKEDQSVRVGWVDISCTSHWLDVGNYLTPLKEMASLIVELGMHLFCKLHPRKLLARSFRMANRDGAVDQHIKVDAMSGLYYPFEDETDIDIPTMARFNVSDTMGFHGDYTDMSYDAFAEIQVYYALESMGQNFRAISMGSVGNPGYLIARRKAVEVLVHGRGSQAPCYAWDDKLVATILLSSPTVFLQAIHYWENQDELSNLTKGLRDAGVLDETQDVDWVPNTLIAVLAGEAGSTVHRLLPRPVPMGTNKRVCVGTLRIAANDQHVQARGPQQKRDFLRLCEGLFSCGIKTGGQTRKTFLGYFMGHLPMVTVDALPFKTTVGTALPSMNDYVYRKLQEASLADSNMVMVRQPWTKSKEQQAGQCWHCQQLLAHGFDTPGAMQAPTRWISPMASDYTPPPGVRWGLGSFDPLNAFSFFDAGYQFGQHADSIGVLLERDRRNYLHAYSVVYFGLLGSQGPNQVSTCSSCYGVIVYDFEGDVIYNAWTLMPILGYNLHNELRKSEIDLVVR
ncbi:hypothetical protein GOP47_0013778 [Adiantum capillus-veneris]|uniref:Uncharacterized protein n=1 Tax=Adiantum capillus-veneris TaxID=13818 RepID=A0A9D4ZEV9_ADICA|nr:hypothetical protein GOP47_0013778 [Adiantum capillus-veneris]